jgi:hypothetical protein
MTASLRHTVRERIARKKANFSNPPVDVYTDGGCRRNPGVGDGPQSYTTVRSRRKLRASSGTRPTTKWTSGPP